MLVVGASVAASIRSTPAHSQGAGSAEPPAQAPESREPADDDESTTAVTSGLTAPADPKARKAWLEDKLAKAIAAHPKLGKAKLAVAITDITTGLELFAHEPDKGMNLASNAKLLTSVAALATLGSGFRWHTAVYASDLDDATGAVAGDLYVRGHGDPTLSWADLRGLADDVAARGIKSIAGKLVIDTGYFDGQSEPPHYDEQKNERAGFRAPVASFGVAHSAVTVIVAAEPGAKKALIRLEPDAGDYVRIAKREATTVTEGRTRVRVDAKPKSDHLEIDVSGQIRAVDGSFDVRKRVDDPARFAAEVFRRALAERGVTVRGYGTGTIPVGAKLIAAHDSAPLAHVMREMNKMSDNYVAETVLKTLGAETRGTPGATWADGTAAVRAYLATIGIPAGSYRADNGSGLYGASEVTAHQLVKILLAAHHDYRIGPDLVASLPVGGVDGTLAKRWKDHPARGRVRAKTGTLDKVTALAGYLAVDSGHPLAFAIVVNDIPAGRRGDARTVADEMIDALVAYLTP